MKGVKILINELTTIFWFLDSAPTETFPQMSGLGNQKRIQGYLDCLIVASSSTRRWNPDVKILFISDNFKFLEYFPRHKDHLESIGVEFRIIERLSTTPHGFYHSWQSQFYILDILRSLKNYPGRKLVLDLDIIVCGPLTYFEKIDTDAGGLIIPYFSDDEVNGLSRKSLSEISERISMAKVDAPLPYYGGELLFVNSSLTSETLDLFFQKNIEYFSIGLPHINEEGHLFSLVAHQNNWIDFSLDSVAKRIWTQPWIYRNINMDDRKVVIKHLPAEKKTSFRLLAKMLISNESRWFWSEEQELWNKRIGRITGIPRYSLRKLISDSKFLAPNIPRAIFKRLTSKSGKPIG